MFVFDFPLIIIITTIGIIIIIIIVIIYLISRSIICSHRLMWTYYININRIQENELNRLKIPTGRRETSWPCLSVAKELNHW